ncbi:MAG: DUF4411 family protein [Nitrospinae bacterium]|nr:DUF4411 family protein [Nitrospinota bacterium]
MIYVFDSDTLSNLFKNFYQSRFPSLWEKFDNAVADETIISVSEVYEEIHDHGERLSKWVKQNKKVFQRPSPEEMGLVSEIFKVSHFQSLVKRQSLLNGKPVADPFVIAKAWHINACVVTQEKEKPNAAKIPNVCKHFNVDCTDLEGFMERENWTF